MNKLPSVRTVLDTAAKAGIPTRPPYGIVLNRRGAMLDPRSVGYLAAPDWQPFYRMILNDYVRPLGRLFFAQDMMQHCGAAADDASFAFSIQHQAGGDTSIRYHTDASSVTFNINLDTTQTCTGSSLLFVDPVDTNKRHLVPWKPGHAVVHLGRTMHVALPIESGTRSNLVIWTMPSAGAGEYGSLVMSASTDSSKQGLPALGTPTELWTKPTCTADTTMSWKRRWTPF